jgi:bacitracin synthase 1
MQVIELNDGVMLSWDYVSEAFENDVIESMFEEYTHIIDQSIFSGVFIVCLANK